VEILDALGKPFALDVQQGGMAAAEKNRRPDTAIEMAGSTRAFELAYRITRRGGTTVTAGLPPPDATWAMPAVNLVAEERTIKGSYVGTCVPMRDIPRYVDLCRGGRLPVERLLTGTLALDDINRGFDLLHDGKAVRQVVLL
jgi:alcohol dehydrogenase